MAMGHYDEIQKFYGTKIGLRVARKHLGWYMDYVQTPDQLRRDVFTARSIEETMILLPAALNPSQWDAAA